MAPKTKITKEMIVDTAYDLLINEGGDALNSRGIAERLGCSTQPIYSYFKDMSELLNDVVQKARDGFVKSLFDKFDKKAAFLSLSLSYINIAVSNPNLFKFLLFSNYNHSLSPESLFELLKTKIDYKEVFGKFSEIYNMDEDSTRSIFVRIWEYVHGTASYVAVGESFTKESEERLTNTINEIVRGEMMRRNFG